jgi:hypothetical protein
MTNQTLQTLSQVLIAVGILFTALGDWGSYYFGQRVQRDKEAVMEKKEKEIAAHKAYSGVLAPKDELLFVPGKQIYPQLEFGDSGSILKFAGQQGSPLFKIAEDNDITIEVEGGQIKVSTKIRDKKGNLVAEIIKNEWKVNPDKSWDRNYSKDALEVKDPTGDIVLQVRIVKERVQFQAKLYDATGRGIGFGKMKGPNGWGGAIELTGPNHPKLTLKIEPIFKYPSALHLGEFATATKQGT